MGGLVILENPWKSSQSLILDVFSLLQGVGVALLLVQGMVGVNSLVVTSWMFVYFRDSFGTMTGSFTWTECQHSVPSFR